MKAGGIVLCGGRSTRMGVPKATLPFGLETMLQRVVRLLGTVVSPIVVVAAREQELDHPVLERLVPKARAQRPILYCGGASLERQRSRQAAVR